MLVMSNERLVGNFRCNDGKIYRDGDVVAIEVFEIEDEIASGSMSHNIRRSVIRAPVRRVYRSVNVNQLDLINRFRSGYDKGDIIALACNDRVFTDFVQNGCDITVAEDIEGFKLVVTASLTVIEATLDLSEKLFDLDEFTPA